MIAGSETTGALMPNRSVKSIIKSKSLCELGKALNTIRKKDNRIGCNSKKFTLIINANKFLYNDSFIFSGEDEAQIMQWVDNPEKKLYMNNLYRVELRDYILLVQLFNTKKDNNILIGYLLSNDIITRLELAECFQQFLFKKMLRN